MGDSMLLVWAFCKRDGRSGSGFVRYGWAILINRICLSCMVCMFAQGGAWYTCLVKGVHGIHVCSRGCMVYMFTQGEAKIISRQAAWNGMEWANLLILEMSSSILYIHSLFMSYQMKIIASLF